MASKIIVFATALAACNAVPVLIEEESYVPGVIMRIGRSPNMAFGFASNIGGISRSSSMSSSFQGGDTEPYYGAGLGGPANGNFARAVGIANAGPSPYLLGYQAYNGGLRNSFDSAASAAQNYGNYGSAVSSARTHNGHQFGSASSAVRNNGPHFQSAVSSAQNLRGLDYDSNIATAHNNGMDFGSAVSITENTGDYGSTMSAAQSRNDIVNFGSAVSAAQNIGGYRSSTAQAMQHRAGSLQHSGASSINAPGVQAAQSRAINNGFY